MGVQMMGARMWQRLLIPRLSGAYCIALLAGFGGRAGGVTLAVVAMAYIMAASDGESRLSDTTVVLPTPSRTSAFVTPTRVSSEDGHEQDTAQVTGTQASVGSTLRTETSSRTPSE